MNDKLEISLRPSKLTGQTRLDILRDVIVQIFPFAKHPIPNWQLRQMIWVELHENEASRATISVFTYANKKIIPQNCCVPGCTKKVFEENGMKIFFQKFPEDRDLFR